MATIGPGRSGWATTPWGVGAVWEALVLTLAMNALATVLPLAGRTTGDISARFPVMITPAGYMFSVWGVIYAGLLSFAVYQSLPKPGQDGRGRGLGWYSAEAGRVAQAVGEAQVDRLHAPSGQEALHEDLVQEASGNADQVPSPASNGPSGYPAAPWSRLR